MSGGGRGGERVGRECMGMRAHAYAGEPWGLRGRAWVSGVRWEGRQWISNGSAMDQQWIRNGLAMDQQWMSNGLAMVWQ